MMPGKMTHERLRQFANGIRELADAYPVHIWPEPDMARVHEILQAHGLGLDVVAASIRREVFGTLVKRLDESCPEK